MLESPARSAALSLCCARRLGVVESCPEKKAECDPQHFLPGTAAGRFLGLGLSAAAAASGCASLLVLRLGVILGLAAFPLGSALAAILLRMKFHSHLRAVEISWESFRLKDSVLADSAACCCSLVPVLMPAPIPPLTEKLLSLPCSAGSVWTRALSC